MKPDQVRERMELYGLGLGEGEQALFLKDVCNAYEELFYNLVEKEDKVNALNDAIKYYKNMEDNMAQMLSTISEISEKTEKAAEKTAELAIREAEGKADVILADASQEAAQILEDAKIEAKEIVGSAQDQIADAKKELEEIKEEINTYSLQFYHFLEAQKAFFEEHKIDLEHLQIQKPTEVVPSSIQTIQVVQAPQVVEETKVVQEQKVPLPNLIQEREIIKVAMPEEQAAIIPEHKLEDATINQIRKIPNISAQQAPTIEEIEAGIPENIRNIPISDHTETLDEIIQSIKKSYEEVENR